MFARDLFNFQVIIDARYAWDLIIQMCVIKVQVWDLSQMRVSHAQCVRVESSVLLLLHTLVIVTYTILYGRNHSIILSQW